MSASKSSVAGPGRDATATSYGLRYLSRAAFLVMLLALGICALPVGCVTRTSTTEPTSLEERQKAAIDDPMGYKPQVGHVSDRSGISDFDGDGLKHDINNILNP